MRFVPNAITLSRLLFAILLVPLALTDNYVAAFFLLAIGYLTDWLDGYVARRTGFTSDLGKNVLEPLCDGTLMASAIVMLWLTGYWSMWVPIGIIVINFALQPLHSTRFKRHAYYIHPFYAVAIMVVSVLGFCDLAFDVRTLPLIGFGLVSVFALVVSKRDRIEELLAGPPVRVS